jgi:hypothetical protein
LVFLLDHPHVARTLCSPSTNTRYAIVARKLPTSFLQEALFPTLPSAVSLEDEAAFSSAQSVTILAGRAFEEQVEHSQFPI